MINNLLSLRSVLTTRSPTVADTRGAGIAGLSARALGLGACGGPYRAPFGPIGSRLDRESHPTARLAMGTGKRGLRQRQGWFGNGPLKVGRGFESRGSPPSRFWSRTGLPPVALRPSYNPPSGDRADRHDDRAQVICPRGRYVRRFMRSRGSLVAIQRACRAPA